MTLVAFTVSFSYLGIISSIHSSLSLSPFFSLSCTHTHIHMTHTCKNIHTCAHTDTSLNGQNQPKLFPAHIHVRQQLSLPLLRKFLVTFGAGEKVLLLAQCRAKCWIWQRMYRFCSSGNQLCCCPWHGHRPWGRKCVFPVRRLIVEV